MSHVKIFVIVGQVKSEKGSFPIYTAVKKDGTRIPLKFVKTVLTRPDSRSYITCPVTAVHEGKDRKGYRCLWVKEVTSIEPAVENVDDASERLGADFEITD